jgi:curved DNA-binding protein CbpA
MTDYFALLDQPRRPWLDLDALKQAFHQKSLTEHPDAQAPGGSANDAEATFALLNEAHQTLQDPKRRLQHLVALQGHAPTARFDSVPPDIADLFPVIAQVTQDAERLGEKAANATSALSRSLLASELVHVRDRVESLLARLTSLQAEADSELQRINGGFDEHDSDTVAALHRLYVRYSFLQRWLAQLNEHSARLNSL